MRQVQEERMQYFDKDGKPIAFNYSFGSIERGEPIRCCESVHGECPYFIERDGSKIRCRLREDGLPVYPASHCSGPQVASVNRERERLAA